MRDTGIADRIRAKGVRVVEVSGWQTRGSDSFSPVGSVNHHTAGPASGSTPSLNTCIYGRPDVPGPLCQVMQSREPDGNDIAYVIASGKANHAGEGGWGGMSGNSSCYGLEIEHTGVDPLPMGRQQIAAKIHAALHDRPDKVCQHSEWTTRKIDAATGVDANQFRAMVSSYESGGSVPPPSDGGFDLSDDQYNKIMKELKDIETKVESVGGGQNAIAEATHNSLDVIKNQIGKCVRDENDKLWIISSVGRWELDDHGRFSRGAILQWLQVLGLVSPGDPVRADNDYIGSIPVIWRD